MNDKIVDGSGVVHEKGWDGQYKPVQGLLGPQRETDWLGSPKFDRDWKGDPVEERDWLGNQRESRSGDPLYRSGDSASGDAGAALAGGLAVIVVLGAVLLVGAVAALAVKAIGALFKAWAVLARRYPKTMLIVHLSLGTAGVFVLAREAGASEVASSGASATVLLVWAWQWLTRRWPYVLMPINAGALGCGLWFLSSETVGVWEPSWSEWTRGLPGVGNLPAVLAGLPLSVWFWALAQRRWPTAFTPASCIVAGGAAWFLFTRIWTDWQPAWDASVAPVPLLPSADIVLLTAPLGVWLWYRAQVRWPSYMAPVNLLALGGVSGLGAHHTEWAWRDTWDFWAGGLPLASAPVAAIGLAPVSAWSWRQAYAKWPRLFVVPSLALLGALLYVVLDRTRPSWAPQWVALWGMVPLRPDPASFAGALPVGIWCYREGLRRWAAIEWPLQVALSSAILWWFAARSRPIWDEPWRSFGGVDAPDLAVVAALLPVLFGAWARLRRVFPSPVSILANLVMGAVLAWIVGRAFPTSSLALGAAVAVLPIVSWVYVHLLRRHPRFGLAVLLVPGSVLVLAAAVWPEEARAFADAFVASLLGVG